MRDLLRGHRILHTCRLRRRGMRTSVRRMRGNDQLSLLYARGVHNGNVREPAGRMWEP
jgi:hypothetical protein